MKEIKVDTFYANRAYYPFIPPAVFDALEGAYLEGRAVVAVPVAAYDNMVTQLKNAGLCPGQ